MEPSPPLSARDYAAVVFKYRRMILAIVILTTTLVTGAAYIVLSPQFEATARLLIKPGRQNAPPVSVVQRGTNPALYHSNLSKEDINSEVEILKSGLLIEKAVDVVGADVLSPPLTRGEGLYQAVKYYFKVGYRAVKDEIRQFLYTIGLYTEITERQRLLLGVARNLDVQQVRNTNVIEVRFAWPHPGIAAAFVNTLVDLYFSYQLEVHRRQQILGFFDEEVADVMARLERTEQNLHAFKAATGVVAPNDQRSLLLERKSRLQADIQIADAEAAGLAAKLGAIDEQLARDSQRLAVSSPAINQQLRQQYVTLKVELEGLRERQRTLKNSVAEIDDSLNEIDRHEVRLNELARVVDIEKENFVLYRMKQEEIKLSSKMDLNKIVDVSIVDPAQVPARPTRIIRFVPNRVLYILAAVFGSLAGAILLAFFRHSADQTVDTKWKIERTTGLKVLASIPELERV